MVGRKMYEFDDRLERSYDSNRGTQFFEELSTSTLAYRDLVLLFATAASVLIGYRILTHLFAGFTDPCRSLFPVNSYSQEISEDHDRNFHQPLKQTLCRLFEDLALNLIPVVMAIYAALQDSATYITVCIVWTTLMLLLLSPINKGRALNTESSLRFNLWMTGWTLFVVQFLFTTSMIAYLFDLLHDRFANYGGFWAYIRSNF